MAGAGKKTFTAGEVLTASDVNTYLMEQSVMVFGGTAARSSAIPTPSEGMTTYRTDSQQIESYDGSEWRGMSGLQLVKKQTIGSGVTSVTVTNAFSATYENYLIRISGGAASADENGALTLGASAANYNGSLLYTTYASTTLNGATDSASTKFSFIWRTTVAHPTANINLSGPFLAKPTAVNGTWITSTAAGNYTGLHNVSTSYTDFTITPTAPTTLTGGTIYVYGYGT